MTSDTIAPETLSFEADVARLLHMMVHSVYSDRDVFLRELISNAADACEKLRYEAITRPELLADGKALCITVTADAERKRLTIEDNGIGMSREDLVEALGTIARSGTRAFMERIEAAKAGEGAELIGQFGVGFYSAFMVAEKVEVFSRAAGGEGSWRWSSDGKGAYEIGQALSDETPARGTRVVLHLMDDAENYAQSYTLEKLIKEQSGHVAVPVYLVEKPGGEARQIADGTALWTRSKGEIKSEEYTEFYRGISGDFDEPAAIVHYRAEGRQEYSALAYVPGSRPFDLFDPDRTGRFRLYVRRVFITDEADILPRYLRFVRGLVDSADLPLNLSREMIQESPLLAAIRKGVTNRILGDLEKLAENDGDAFIKIWESFGVVLKEGIYEDWERKEQLLKLARFHSTAGDEWRSLSDYTGAMKVGQKAIYYISGDDRARLEASPQLEGFRARGVEVLLLTDPVDSFWVTSVSEFEGKTFKSVTQGGSDLPDIPLTDNTEDKVEEETSGEVNAFISFIKSTLGDAVSDVRASDRLTESAVCLVAPDHGPDRQIERLLSAAGQLETVTKPILEINPRNTRIVALAAKGDDDPAFREDVAHLLYDEARVLDGDKPVDPFAFSERLARIVERGLGG